MCVVVWVRLLLCDSANVDYCSHCPLPVVLPRSLARVVSWKPAKPSASYLCGYCASQPPTHPWCRLPVVESIAVGEPVPSPRPSYFRVPCPTTVQNQKSPLGESILHSQTQRQQQQHADSVFNCNYKKTNCGQSHNHSKHWNWLNVWKY